MRGMIIDKGDFRLLRANPMQAIHATDGEPMFKPEQRKESTQLRQDARTRNPGR